MSYQCRVPLRESICSLDVDQMVSVRPKFATEVSRHIKKRFVDKRNEFKFPAKTILARMAKEIRVATTTPIFEYCLPPHR